jgi:hypothetical protein
MKMTDIESELEDVEKQIKEQKLILVGLKEKRRILKNSIIRIKTTHKFLDIFPEKLDSVYKPSNWRIYKEGKPKYSAYVVKYEDYKFRIGDYDNEFCPGSFSIAMGNLGQHILPYSGSLPMLVRLYYKSPAEVTHTNLYLLISSYWE